MRRGLACTLLLLALSTPAAAETGPCNDPRAAARQFLDNLQRDNYHPQAATRCFERPSDLSEAELRHRVEQLKAVLDHRGLFVLLDDLPNTAEHRDDDGRARANLVGDFDDVYLRRQGDEWRFPATVVRHIPRLYQDTFSGLVEQLVIQLPASLRTPVLGLQIWQLLALMGMLILAIMTGGLVNLVVRSRLTRLFGKLQSPAGARALERLARPLGLLVGAAVAATILPELRLPIGLSRLLFIAVRLFAAIAGVVMVYRLVDLLVLRLEAKAQQTETKMDDQIVILVRKTLRVVVVAAGLIFVLQNLNVDVTGLLAGLGIGGLALALAAKDTAANLFGSLTIFVDAPFYIGDWIKAAGVEGTVEEIGLRSTRVRTFANSQVTVPNSKLADSNIENFSRRVYRRYVTRLAIGYGSSAEQIEAFVEGIRAIIAHHPDTRKDAYEVHFVDYGESALEIMIYAFFKVPSWSAELQARHQVLVEIKRLAAEIGVEFAFPTRTLHLETQAEPSPARLQDAPDAEALAAAVVGFGPGGDRGQPRGVRLTHGYFAQAGSPRGAADSGA